MVKRATTAFCLLVGACDGGPVTPLPEVELPACLEEPPLGELPLADCEADALTCDLIGDASDATVDITQLWSRIDDDKFVITVELGGRALDTNSDVGIGVIFDVNRSFELADDPFQMTLAHDTSSVDSVRYDIAYDEIVFVNVFGVEIERHYNMFASLDVDCGSAMLSGENRIEVRVSLDEVLGADEKVVFAVYVDDGQSSWPELSSDCLWLVATRGTSGTPDVAATAAPLPWPCEGVVEP